MKKLLLLAVLALALPMAVFADSGVDYTNSGGTLAGSNSGLTLSGSTLIAVKGLNGGGLITGNDLGSVTFATGALISGDLADGWNVRWWRVVHHHRERHQRNSERNIVRRNFRWSRVLDVDNSRQRNSQLHADGHCVGNGWQLFNSWCDGTIDNQYRQGLFQRQHEHLER